MSAPELGSWEPLSLDAAVRKFASAPVRWWISGGHALELHLQRSWRDHDDTDVSVVRGDLPAVWTLLSEWDVHIAAAGQLTAWRGEPLDPDRHQNNLWCRVATGTPWILDVTIGEGSKSNWIYRRDPSIQRPWDTAVLCTTDGIPYLAPELQLLFKSKGRRLKDDLDAAEVIPTLDEHQRGHLVRYLQADHPWQRLLA